jgi:hypothetical protein
METATLSDMLIDGFDCGNVRKTKTDGNREFAQGLLVQQDADGNLRVTRMDFWHGAEIDEPWYLDAPAADRSHHRQLPTILPMPAKSCSFCDVNFLTSISRTGRTDCSSRPAG